MAEILGCAACYPSGQVATKTQIRPEDYLRMSFEHDAEFVHGDIVERSMPDYIHGRIQSLVSFQFGMVTTDHHLYPCSEVRMKVAPDLYRIPDVSVFAGSPPQDRVPETPPLVVVEIVSDSDRHLDLMQKLEEYRNWGVRYFWVINPMTKGFASYTEVGLQNVSSFSLEECPFQLTPAELFANL
jgi:Uma2 family endonuclease